MDYWLRALVDPGTKIGDGEKIVSSKTPNPIINRTIIAIIQTIYEKQTEREKYHVDEVKYRLVYQMQLEEYTALSNNKEHAFQEVWNNVFNELSNVYFWRVKM